MRRGRGGDRGNGCDRERQAETARIRRRRRHCLESRLVLRRDHPRLCGEDRVKLDVLQQLNEERSARRAAILITDIGSGAQRLVKAADVNRDPLSEVLQQRLRSGKSGMVETPQGPAFLTVYVPP